MVVSYVNRALGLIITDILFGVTAIIMVIIIIMTTKMMMIIMIMIKNFINS